MEIDENILFARQQLQNGNTQILPPPRSVTPRLLLLMTKIGTMRTCAQKKILPDVDNQLFKDKIYIRLWNFVFLEFKGDFG